MRSKPQLKKIEESLEEIFRMKQSIDFVFVNSRAKSAAGKFVFVRKVLGSSKQVCYNVPDDVSWIYNNDFEIQQQSEVWLFENEDQLTIVLRGSKVKTKMIAAFSKSSPVNYRNFWGTFINCLNE